jgi:VanZ family protein
LVIFALSAAPGSSLPRLNWIWQPDKWAHFFVYGVLSTLIWLSFASTASPRHRRRGWPVVIATSYGVLLEVGQFAFFPNRYFEVWDIVANFSGACLAAWLCERIINYN